MHFASNSLGEEDDLNNFHSSQADEIEELLHQKRLAEQGRAEGYEQHQQPPKLLIYALHTLDYATQIAYYGEK
jgi:site-specific recombinase XerC